jgi:hypothetical protein
MTKQELAAIESRANAATREPWIVDGTYVPTASLSAVSVYGMGMEVAECQMDADGAFIAAARVDVPALIAEVRRLRVERDALRQVYEATMDFVGAQGTPYEADQYLMLNGVLAALTAALSALEVQP